MNRQTVVRVFVFAVISAGPLIIRAQNMEQVATVPPNVVLANYDNVPVGSFGGLEGGAFVATSTRGRSA